MSKNKILAALLDFFLKLRVFHHIEKLFCVEMINVDRQTKMASSIHSIFAFDLIEKKKTKFPLKFTRKLFSNK